MASIRSFCALRFTEKAGDIRELVCPPYDIISEEERQRYLARNSNNIIRLELPREGEDPYAQAGATLKSWLDDRILAFDDVPALYIYEEEFVALGQRKTIRGLVCGVRLEPFSEGGILPHEETLSKAKTDRFNLMQATSCNFSSIYSLYFDKERTAAARLDTLTAGPADVEFETDDGIVHRVWVVTEIKEINQIVNYLRGKTLYIADGHHRYETALNYRDSLARQGEFIDDTHPANYVMMTLVDMENEGLVVFPTHRIIRNMEDFDPAAVLDQCQTYFDSIPINKEEAQARLDEAAAAGKKAFAMYARGEMTLLTLRDGAVMDEMLAGMSDAYRQLDVTILHTLVLEKLMGIDKENMANQKNLIYTRDPAEALAAVDKGEANCAFLINPTRVDEIASVAGAGEKMPQKSTYFYPKLITGHIINPLF
ncbi:DUF1015 domain-containing protein [Ruminococcaceae bacterium OttesenSCG-928-L11]|nr:DUF1015 domain-containing protein [Ruminococcaceae bacterium OttesenSCG-928-L11]